MNSRSTRQASFLTSTPVNAGRPRASRVRAVLPSLVLLAAVGSPASAQTTVFDIWPGEESSSPRELTEVDGNLFFAAFVGLHSSRLWRSAAGGTSLQSIAGVTNPNQLTAIDGTLFFSGYTADAGTELMRCEGTTAWVVKDISPGTTVSTPSGLTNVDGTLFFTANTGGNSGRELWKSDGTPGGTMMVRDITPGSGSTDFGSYPDYPNFVAVGSTLFFVADDGVHGRELWKSDGTASGTVMVKDINPGSGSAVRFSSDSVTFAPVLNMIHRNGLLYFQADDGTNGRELWRSDGTTAGTVMVKNIATGGGSSTPDDFAESGGVLYFAANDSVCGRELWRTDGTAAGTTMVKDIYPGGSYSAPSWLTDIDGTLFFQAGDGTNGTELWKSDGSAAGTVLVKDINLAGLSSTPGKPGGAHGVAYFGADTFLAGTEFWRSDGTGYGTQLLEDINLGHDPSYPHQFTAVGDRLFFAAADPSHGRELRVFELPAPEPVPATSANSLDSGSSGDPIDTFTGELYDLEAPDLFLDGPMPLLFQRYYASNLRKSFILGDLGSNWLHNFDARLLINGNTAIYISSTGRVTKFLKTGTPLVWTQLTNLDTPYQISSSGGQDAVLFDPTEDRVYTFDYTTNNLVAGKLVKVEDGHGHRHTVTYDPASGQLLSVEDGLGRAITFTYNADAIPKIASVSDGVRSVIFKYTNHIDPEYLTRTTNSLGGETTYSYENTSQVADHALMRARQRPALNTPFRQTWYDTTSPWSSGRVSTQTDASGNVYRFEYTPLATRETRITDPLTNVMIHTHSNLGALTSLQEEQGLSCFIAVDLSGRRTGLTDRLGDGTTYTYHPPSGKLASVTNAEGGTTSFTYGARAIGALTSYDLTSIEHADGTTETFGYDSRGRMTIHVDQLGNEASSTYDPNGMPLTETNRAGGTITNTFDAYARVTSTTNSSGHTTNFAYDPLGRLEGIVFADASTRSFTYDDLDHLLSRTNENGDTVSYSYDANGNLRSIENPLRQRWEIAYDGNDRPTSKMDPLGNANRQTYDPLGRVGTDSDPNGHTRTYAYDLRGHLSSITTPGGQVWSFSHDDEGILSSATTPLGHRTSYESDRMGRTTRITTPTGHAYRMSYDAMGRIVGWTDPHDHATTLSRDARGLISEVAMPNAARTTYARDALGNIIRLTDPNGNAWTSTFNASGQRTSDVDPLGNAITFSRDNRGRTALVAYPAGMGTLGLEYDPAGRLTRTVWSDGTAHTFTYDDADRLTEANGISLGYDAAGRVTSCNGILLEPDPGGRIASMTLAPGKTVAYAYDANDRVTRVVDWAGGRIDLRYDDDNRLNRIVRPNGVNARFTYDANGRIASITEGTLSDIHLVRDARGNVTSAARSVPTAPSAEGLVNEWHSYDEAARMTHASYDELGRLTEEGKDKYHWNLASHLTRYRRGGTTTRSTYDASGQRLSRTRGGRARSYVWNVGWSTPSISVEREDGEDRFYYVHLPDGRLLYRLAASNDARDFYHFDEIGNTLYVTDDDGAIAASYAYSPFGRLLGSTGELDNSFTWQGQHGVMADGEDLYYLRARYYDGRAGRFLSRDPARAISPMGVNPYQYANSNPRRYVDLTGLSPDEPTEAARARRSREEQTVHIDGRDGGRTAFVQLLLGKSAAEIYGDAPPDSVLPELTPNPTLEGPGPVPDDIESVIPELTPTVFFRPPLDVEKAYVPRRGQEAQNVVTSAREAIVEKGKHQGNQPALEFEELPSLFDQLRKHLLLPDPDTEELGGSVHLSVVPEPPSIVVPPSGRSRGQVGGGGDEIRPR